MEIRLFTFPAPYALTCFSATYANMRSMLCEILGRLSETDQHPYLLHVLLARSTISFVIIPRSLQSD